MRTGTIEREHTDDCFVLFKRITALEEALREARAKFVTPHDMHIYRGPSDECGNCQLLARIDALLGETK